MHDVKQVIFNPKSINQVEYDNTHKNLKVKITGIAIDGKELTLVIGCWEDEWILITVY